jgi:beta-galactosidase
MAHIYAHSWPVRWGNEGEENMIKVYSNYQVEKWGKPAKLLIEKLKEENGVSTLQVKLLDEKGAPCLDAANWVQFGLAGDGKLVDDLGTASGSRYVQLYNGRAIINVQTNKGHSVVSATSGSLPTVFINL